MRLRYGCGVWEIFLPGVSAGDCYKNEIRGPSGELVPLKADPYALQAEPPPRTAPVVHGVPSREWPHSAWLAARLHPHTRETPITYSELSLCSRMRAPEGCNSILPFTVPAVR